jgi:hypothetical protein
MEQETLTTLTSGLKQLPFNVVDLDVTVAEGFPFKWKGRDIDSGQLIIKLGEPGSHGVIDYEAQTVSVEFRVQIVLSELAELLDDIGASPDFAAPVNAIIRSQGAVFTNNHALRLAGKVEEIAEHKIFNNSTQIDILAPTRCMPSDASRSALEVKDALVRGEPVTWNFNPAERRVVLKLPDDLGGETHVLCLAGSYTLAALPQEARA